MRIVLLAGGSSIHTIRWANGLSDSGVDVHLITQHPPLEPVVEGVKVHQFPYRGVLGYFLMVPGVRKLVRDIAPDIVNAHYASGYGTTARFLRFHPWVLSVWGSDVYAFPKKTPFHRYLVRKNLLAADRVASTSQCMAEQTRGLAPELGEISITPFGVEMESFDAIESLSPDVDDDDRPLVVGTVKSMAPNYGVDTLIQAFAIMRQRLRESGDTLAGRLRLRLVGDGPQAGDLQELSRQFGIDDVTTFVGRVPHTKVPEELAGLDIYVALSRFESFGVAIIEAGAAARPVVVSDADGLSEVTIEGETGLVVPRDNAEAASEAILRLARDPSLRSRMGAAARQHVVRHYGWPACIDTMRRVYEKTIRDV